MLTKRMRLVSPNAIVDGGHDICGQRFKKIQNPDCERKRTLPPLRSNMHDRELRNSSHYCLPKCRTERYKNYSFVPKMCPKMLTMNMYYILYF